MVLLVKEAGVDNAATAVRLALQHGCTCDQIAAAVSYKARNPDLGAGLLYGKLLNMVPGEPVERRFPRREKPAQRRTNDPHLSAAAADQQRAAEERREFEQLEQSHGAQLDALSEDQTRALAAECGAGVLAEFIRKPKSGIVRAAMLKAIAGPSGGGG